MRLGLVVKDMQLNWLAMFSPSRMRDLIFGSPLRKYRLYKKNIHKSLVIVCDNVKHSSQKSLTSLQENHHYMASTTSTLQFAYKSSDPGEIYSKLFLFFSLSLQIVSENFIWLKAHVWQT